MNETELLRQANRRLRLFYVVKDESRSIQSVNSKVEIYEKNGLYKVFVISAIGSVYLDAHLIYLTESEDKAIEIATGVVY